MPTFPSLNTSASSPPPLSSSPSNTNLRSPPTSQSSFSSTQHWQHRFANNEAVASPSSIVASTHGRRGSDGGGDGERVVPRMPTHNGVALNLSPSPQQRARAFDFNNISSGDSTEDRVLPSIANGGSNVSASPKYRPNERSLTNVQRNARMPLSPTSPSNSGFSQSPASPSNSSGAGIDIRRRNQFSTTISMPVNYNKTAQLQPILSSSPSSSDVYSSNDAGKTSLDDRYQTTSAANAEPLDYYLANSQSYSSVNNQIAVSPSHQSRGVSIQHQQQRLNSMMGANSSSPANRVAHETRKSVVSPTAGASTTFLSNVHSISTVAKSTPYGPAANTNANYNMNGSTRIDQLPLPTLHTDSSVDPIHHAGQHSGATFYASSKSDFANQHDAYTDSYVAPTQLTSSPSSSSMGAIFNPSNLALHSTTESGSNYSSPHSNAGLDTRDRAALNKAIAMRQTSHKIGGMLKTPARNMSEAHLK